MLTYFGTLIMPYTSIKARFPNPSHATDAMSQRELMIFASLRSALALFELIFGLLTKNTEFVFVGKYNVFPKLH
jgi:hypothetical protein